MPPSRAREVDALDAVAEFASALVGRSPAPPAKKIKTFTRRERRGAPPPSPRASSPPREVPAAVAPSPSPSRDDDREEEDLERDVDVDVAPPPARTREARARRSSPAAEAEAEAEAPAPPPLSFENDALPSFPSPAPLPGARDDDDDDDDDDALAPSTVDNAAILRSPAGKAGAAVIEDVEARGRALLGALAEARASGERFFHSALEVFATRVDECEAAVTEWLIEKTTRLERDTADDLIYGAKLEKAEACVLGFTARMSDARFGGDAAAAAAAEEEEEETNDKALPVVAAVFVRPSEALGR
jgi:hypothetical protein